MELTVIGISHKKAPIKIREKASFLHSAKLRATKELKVMGINEFMILSTCNRSEIYIATRDMKNDIKKVVDYYVAFAEFDISPYLFIKKYEGAIVHIYQVASGLDSLIIGEDQILGQVKEALEFGMEQKSCRKYLSKVVREAITFSKKMKNTYKLSENQLSVSSIGVRFLKDKLGNLRHKKILVIGTGEMGRLVIKYLKDQKVKDIYITNRTHKRLKECNESFEELIHLDYDERYEWLAKMDIVITATSSPHIIIKADNIKFVDTKLTILDMAVPRDVGEEVKQLPNIDVYTLDDFKSIADQHLKERKKIANRINRLILDEVKMIEKWILSTKVDSVIRSLQWKQETVSQQTIEKIKTKVELDEDEYNCIEKHLRLAVQEMIRQPIKELKRLEKESDIDNYKMVIEKLFDLKEGE